ncbi:family 20 glycosylhydrolase [Enterovibrio norvegicus]|uniref:family 20 glycosylhydrolase n=1 Tax=Enterovibrio norvegicus TaxID=188144 RepID=UPI00352EF2B5
MELIFPAPKRFIEGFSAQRFRIANALRSCPTDYEARSSHALLTYLHDPSLPEQGYRLSYSSCGLNLAYADLHGLRYGHLSINQLIENDAELKFDFVIEDWPDFSARSILLDISRDRVPTLPALKRLIDYWSALRYNQLQLYTEHTFAYKKHETVWRDYTPMTAEDIRDIDVYCRHKGIELVANQACFGHMEKWLNHPEYKHLAEQKTGFKDQRGDHRPGSFGLNPISTQTETFIDGLIAELTPNFSSHTLNINFDETMDLGVGASKSACEIFGKGKVYLNYLQKVLTIANKHGKRCQIFSDMLFRYPNLIDQLPDDLTLLNWGYEPNHPFDAEHKQLALFGYPFHVAVSTSCFASVSGRWNAAVTHMRKAAKSAKKFGAKGYMVTEWGDMGHGQQFSMPIPAYAFGGAMTWGEMQQKDNDVMRAISWFYPDVTQTECDALIALQDIYLMTGIETPNCAFFGPFLFDQASRRHIKHAKGIETNTVNTALNELALWQEKLEDLSSALTKELRWTIDALRLACLIAQGYEQEGHRLVEQFTDDRKTALVGELKPLIRTYRALWTNNYRPGGMNQSTSRLEYLLSLLETMTSKAANKEAMS